MLAPLPEARIAWTDRRLHAAWAALLAAAIVALAFLPKSFTNNDEYYYAGQAYTLGHGRVTPHIGDPLLIPNEPAPLAFRFPVAWPALLAVARLISLRAMYGLALLVHLVGGAAVARMLVRRGVPSALAAVYLFHPVFWIYSRTLMSDMPAAAALMVAMDAWENGSQALAGLALGFSGAVRLANVTTVAGFGLSVVQSWRRRLRGLLLLVVGVGMFWGVQMVVNHTLGGYWLFSTYAKEGAMMFNGTMAAENALLYLGGLALLPPFPLLCALARPRLVSRWALACLPVLLAYIPVSYHNVAPSLLQTLVGGQRYVIPAHAVLMVATAETWGRASVLRRPWVPIGAGVLVALAACLAMRKIESRHRPAAETVAACHPDRVAYNSVANRVAGSVAARWYEVADGPIVEGHDWDVLVLAPGFESNQPGFSSEWSRSPPRIPGATCRLVGSYAIYDFRGRCPPAGVPCP